MANHKHYLIQDREQSAIAEAFRSLRMTLQEITAQTGVKSILFTGSSVSEDNAVMVANAAITLAYSGKKVVLLDCDLRTPVLHKLFCVNNIGVADVLQERKNLNEVLQASFLENLMIVTSGNPVQQPVAMLATQKLSSLIEKLEGQFDYVLVNSPALTISSKAVISDACIVAPKVDGAVLIIEAQKLWVAKARKVVELLQGTKVKILGVVLNHVKTDEAFFCSGYSGNLSYIVRGTES